MTRSEIVEKYARAKAVEGYIRNRFRNIRPEVADDLAQEVYAAALSYDEGKVVDMYERGEFPFWLVRVMLNQMYNGAIWRRYVQFSQRSESLAFEDNEERYADA